MRKTSGIFGVFNEVLKNFIEQQEYISFSHIKLPFNLFFAPKIVEWYYFVFPASEALKKGPNFGFLTLKYA